MNIDNVQSRYWCITDNVHTDKVWWEEAFEGNEVIEAGIAQPEKVAHLHGQAFIILVTKRRGAVVRKWFPGAHIEPMGADCPRDAWNYCLKDRSWTGEWRITKGQCPAGPVQGKRSDLENIRELVKAGKSTVEIVDEVPGALRYMKEISHYGNLLEERKQRILPISSEQLRPWQKALATILDGPVQPRRIFWIWSSHSGVGKTTTMQYLAAATPGKVICGSTDLASLLHAWKKETIVWFDFARSHPIDAKATEVLESVSNCGYMLSTKYMSISKYVCAHVVVTCNRPPPEDRLPKRCVELRLNENGMLAEPVPDVVKGDWYNPMFYDEPPARAGSPSEFWDYR